MALTNHKFLIISIKQLCVYVVSRVSRMSLEGYHLELLAKLNLASDFVDVFRSHPVKCNPVLLKDINRSSVPFMVDQRTFIDNIESRIDKVRTDYLTSIVSAVDDYYSGRNPDLAVKQYYETLSFNDTPHLVNEILRNIDRELEKYSFDNEHHIAIIQRLRDSLKTPLKMVNNNQQSSLCDCGAQLMITNHGNEYYCSNCGCLTYIEAVASSSYRSESSSSHHSNKFDELWTRLMGVEQWEPNDTEDRIVGGYLQSNYTPQEITAYVVRRTIETLSKQYKEISTSLYKHISSLVRLYGKHPPPGFTHDETRKVRIMFNAFSDAAEKHKKKISASFVIYKIIESEFQGNHEKLRILQFIHSKSHKTMSKYHDDFNYICSLSNKNKIISHSSGPYPDHNSCSGHNSCNNSDYDLNYDLGYDANKNYCSSKLQYNQPDNMIMSQVLYA